ncbi:MAG: hypothetical protein IJH67_14355 [Thermoguttaceae bacterium]|nr:hypothetical protein [Thermoguttaceae bacterium]
MCYNISKKSNEALKEENMKGIFCFYSTERVILTKVSGKTIENIETHFENNLFLFDDCKLDIEENDIIKRILPAGKYETYLVTDVEFKRGEFGMTPDHYQVNVQKIKDNLVSHNEPSKIKMSKLSYREKNLMEKLFEMNGGYVLNLNNRQFGELIEEYSNIDVYSDPKYTSEPSKAKKLRKFWNNESDSIVGRVILELLRIREDIIKTQSKDDCNFTDDLADEAKRIEKIANAMVGNAEDNFPTEAERFEADLSTASSVLKDLIKIGERLCINAAYNENTDEDAINDYLRDMLCSKGYDETKDQTRHGISYNGNNAGEVDILITKEGDEIALIEGLKLNSVDKAYINQHIDKAINNYNALGTATFIVAYVSAADYGVFWEKYFEYISNYQYNMTVKRAMEQITAPNASIRIAQIIISKDGYDFPVYFICFNIKN